LSEATECNEEDVLIYIIPSYKKLRRNKRSPDVSLVGEAGQLSDFLQTEEFCFL
jgi:hypothetical protein